MLPDWSRTLKFRIPALCMFVALIAAWVATQAAWNQFGIADRSEHLAQSVFADFWAPLMVIVLLAGAAGRLAANRMTAPLHRLRQQAERWFAKGELADDDWTRDAAEIGSLARLLHEGARKRRQREEETRQVLTRLEAVRENASVGIAFSRNSRLEMVSRNLYETLGWEKGTLEGQYTRVMYASDEDRDALVKRARPAFEDNGAFEGELTLVRRNGEKFWAHMRGTAVIHGDINAGTIWIIEDVTRAYEQRKRLDWEASHDALTGLTNRAAFETLIGQATALAGEQPYSAMFIDLDRFKQVNDSAGHAAGDALLRELAARLALQVRETDTVARFGGDEFAVLLKRCPLENACTIAEKIRVAVDSYRLTWEGREHSVGASIGLVHVDGRFADTAAVLKAADAACYAAKRNGRNRVVVHSESP
ncbi:MAG: diguanylate cyclase [Burkholderiales bacterium]